MMKNHRTALWIFAGVFLTLTDACGADVEIHITGLQPGQGNVLAGLYLSQAAFESERMAYWRAAPVAAERDTKLVFIDLEPGTYGIAVYQDLNSNEVLDKTSLGIPVEPYGFSNNFRNRLRAPDFTDFAFELDEQPAAMEIRLE